MESTPKNQILIELQHKLERIGAFSLIQKIQIEEEIQSILQANSMNIQKILPEISPHCEPEIAQKTLPFQKPCAQRKPKAKDAGKPIHRTKAKNKRIEIQLNLFGN